MLSQFDPAAQIPSSDVIRTAGLSDEGQACTEAGENLRVNLSRLLAARLVADAIRMIAQALPRPYAVAWGVECLERLLEQCGADPAQVEGLRLAKQWLAEPTEENRVAAFEFAERIRYASAEAWIAAAAGLSGGSLAPEGYAVVPPPDAATGHAVYAALQLAAAGAGADLDARLGQFVDRALDIFGAPAGQPGAVAP